MATPAKSGEWPDAHPVDQIPCEACGGGVERQHPLPVEVKHEFKPISEGCEAGMPSRERAVTPHDGEPMMVKSVLRTFLLPLEAFGTDMRDTCTVRLAA